MTVVVLCLRVLAWWENDEIDLSELASIRLGKNAFQFIEKDESTELIMRSEWKEVNWHAELVKLVSLTTEGEDSQSFCNPRHITLESSKADLWIPIRLARIACGLSFKKGIREEETM